MPSYCLVSLWQPTKQCCLQCQSILLALPWHFTPGATQLHSPLQHPLSTTRCFTPGVCLGLLLLLSNWLVIKIFGTDCFTCRLNFSNLQSIPGQCHLSSHSAFPMLYLGTMSSPCSMAHQICFKRARSPSTNIHHNDSCQYHTASQRLMSSSGLTQRSLPWH